MHNIKNQLETLKEFQEIYPTSHVGGSIGLYLRGVNLLRDLRSSDLDVTIDDEIKIDALNNFEDRSDRSDFDYSIKKNLQSGHYVKMDVRISPEPSFDVIEFEGVKYNVSKLRDILFWKTKYAKKGVKKHIYDLETIKSGTRPLEPVEVIDDELPF